MLPDFPRVKQFLLRRIVGLTRAGAQSDPLLALVPAFVIHEGSRARLRREDGSEQTMDFSDPVTASVELSVDDMRKRGPEATREAARDLASQLHTGLAKKMIAGVEEAVASTGNTVDAGGKPVTADMVLETYRKMELTFDRDGKWEKPSFFGHDKAMAQVERVMQEIEENPVLQRKLDEIVDEQRERWRVREASRKLVD